MVQHFFVNGQQFTGLELAAARKAGKIKTKEEAQVDAIKADTKSDVIKKIKAKMKGKGLEATNSVIKFLENNRTTLSDLNGYLKKESNFEVELTITK